MTNMRYLSRYEYMNSTVLLKDKKWFSSSPFCFGFTFFVFFQEKCSSSKNPRNFVDSTLSNSLSFIEQLREQKWNITCFKWFMNYRILCFISVLGKFVSIKPFIHFLHFFIGNGRQCSQVYMYEKQICAIWKHY